MQEGPADEYRRQFSAVADGPRGRGEKTGQTLALSLARMGKQLPPNKTWPLAYWPDGSVKWSGPCDGVAGAVGPLTVAPGAAFSRTAPAIQGHAKPPMRSKSILAN